MSTSFWLDRSRWAPTRNFDVIIVGAGIAGVSAAYWLKREDPGLKIALLEKHRLAYGASGRNAGFITCGSVEHFNRMAEQRGEEEALEIWRFSEKNLSLLQTKIFSQIKLKSFRQRGSFALASTDQEYTELKSTHQLMGKLGIATEALSEQDVQRRLGAVSLQGGIKYLGDAEVNPVELVQAIAQLGQCQILEGIEVYHIEQLAQGRQVKTDAGDFVADMVILATNAYLPQLDSYFRDKIYPTRGQILVTGPVEEVMEGPCYCNFVLDYFRQTEEGHLIIGGFRGLDREGEIGYSDHLSPVIQQALEDFLHKHLPQFSGQKITHRWSGIMGFSADGIPLVGQLPHDPQVFFLGGFTAHGLGLAFHTAKCLVDAIFGRHIPHFLSARRFSGQ